MSKIKRNIALIAHDQKKQLLAEWVEKYHSHLLGHELFCTATTGGVIAKTQNKLSLHLMKSGPLGGDQQIGAMIADGQIDLLIFFTDPLSPHPHDVDVKALTRLATVYDIPMACSPATANLIIKSKFLD